MCIIGPRPLNFFPQIVDAIRQSQPQHGYLIGIESGLCEVVSIDLLIVSTVFVVVSDRMIEDVSVVLPLSLELPQANRKMLSIIARQVVIPILYSARRTVIALFPRSFFCVLMINYFPG